MKVKLTNFETALHNLSFVIRYILLLLLSFTSQAQKKVHILDVFYEALSKDSNEILEYALEGGEFILDDYQIQKINPRTIIARHPDAREYLVDDSLFIIKCRLEPTGNVLDKDSDDPTLEFIISTSTIFNLI